MTIETPSNASLCEERPVTAAGWKQMAENQSRLKGMPEPFILSWQPTDTLHTLLHGESNLLEMIAAGAPLQTILNSLCSALDDQIGKVTSLLSLPEDEEEGQASAPRTASQFGFSVFYSTEVISRSGYLLASFEMYCCIPRTPTSEEVALIERAMLIAARAMERDDPEEDSRQANDRSSVLDCHKIMWSKN